MDGIETAHAIAIMPLQPLPLLLLFALFLLLNPDEGLAAASPSSSPRTPSLLYSPPIRPHSQNSSVPRAPFQL